jgi:hypothetical protein
MTGELNAPEGDRGTDIWNVDEFYVRRINWLVAIGRSDLIDEIADDCERRRCASQPASASCPAPDETVPGATSEPHGPQPDVQNLANAGTRVPAGTRHNVTHGASPRIRPSCAVRHGRTGHSELTAAGGAPPEPVETGTRIAVARLRRTLQPVRWPDRRGLGQLSP